MRKRYIGILVPMVLVSLLYGCQKSPNEAVVKSKNDGSFDVSKVISANETRDPEATESVYLDESFLSSDGSVEFHFHIEEKLSAAGMPIVEVTPPLSDR